MDVGISRRNLTKGFLEGIIFGLKLKGSILNKSFRISEVIIGFIRLYRVLKVSLDGVGVDYYRSVYSVLSSEDVTFLVFIFYYIWDRSAFFGNNLDRQVSKSGKEVSKVIQKDGERERVANEYNCVIYQLSLFLC